LGFDEIFLALEDFGKILEEERIICRGFFYEEKFRYYFMELNDNISEKQENFMIFGFLGDDIFY
jgi:hypothetical protein